MRVVRVILVAQLVLFALRFCSMSERNRQIHYLRGIAAVAIVLLHAMYRDGMRPEFLAAGVEIFFVISGYVMVVSTRDRDFSPVDFLWRRAKRIYPLWWAACALNLILVAPIIGWPVLSPWQDFLLIPHYPKIGFAVSQGWTLVYEMIFYLIFAACWGRWVLAAAVVIAGSTFLPIPYMKPLMLPFVAGMVLANWRPPSSWALPLIVGGVILLLVQPDPSGHWNLRALCLGVPATMIVAGCLVVEIPKSRVLDYLGSASYAIYLGHAIGQQLSVAAGFSAWPITLAAGLAIGAIMYAIFDKPTLQSRGNALNRKIGESTIDINRCVGSDENNIGHVVADVHVNNR